MTIYKNRDHTRSAPTLQLGMSLISRKTVSQSVFMHQENWLIGCGCCSIFKCTQAFLALNMALIDTDNDKNTGGHGSLSRA